MGIFITWIHYLKSTGRTVLHTLVSHKRSTQKICWDEEEEEEGEVWQKVTELLIRHGCDPCKKDHEGFTPNQRADATGNRKLALYLEVDIACFKLSLYCESIVANLLLVCFWCHITRGVAVREKPARWIFTSSFLFFPLLDSHFFLLSTAPSSPLVLWVHRWFTFSCFVLACGLFKICLPLFSAHINTTFCFVFVFFCASTLANPKPLNWFLCPIQLILVLVEAAGR